jgi:hypothetical protein
MVLIEEEPSMVGSTTAWPTVPLAEVLVEVAPAAGLIVPELLVPELELVPVLASSFFPQAANSAKIMSSARIIASVRFILIITSLL